MSLRWKALLHDPPPRLTSVSEMHSDSFVRDLGGEPAK